MIISGMVKRADATEARDATRRVLNRIQLRHHVRKRHNAAQAAFAAVIAGLQRAGALSLRAQQTRDKARATNAVVQRIRDRHSRQRALQRWGRAVEEEGASAREARLTMRKRGLPAWEGQGEEGPMTRSRRLRAAS